MLHEHKTLLALLAACFTGTPVDESVANADWETVFELSKEHAVISLAFAGTAAVRRQIPAELAGKWRKLMLNTMMQNSRVNAVQAEILDLMDQAGLPCAILKGSSFSICYPEPDLRLLGDIDLLTRPQDGEKIKLLLEEAGFRAPETDHPFHIDYCRNGIVLEVHYAASTFPDSPGGRRAEAIMADCLTQVQRVAFDGRTIPVLAPAHQALSALLHMERHMTTSSISLRQMYDWAAFAASVPSEQFAAEVLPVLEECGLARFAQVVTKTCIRYLNMDPHKVLWCSNVSDALTDAMMDEILRAGNMNHAPETDDVSSVMVDRSGSSTLLKNLTVFLGKQARKQFPIVNKVPLLLPVFCIYIPIRFFVRSLFGLRKRKSLSRTVSTAKKRNRLYSDLRLYDTQETQKKDGV